MNVKKAVSYLLLATLLLGGWYGYRLLWGRPLNINHFADRVMLGMLQSRPELMSMLGLVENTPLDFHSDELSDFSPAGNGELLAHVKDAYGILNGYDRSDLRGQQLLTYDYLDFTWSSSLAAFDHPAHVDHGLYVGPYPVNQMSAIHTFPLQTLTQFHQLIDVSSAENYLARMAAIDLYLQHLEQAMERGAEVGARPPRIALQHMVKQLKKQLSEAPDEWEVHRHFQRKTLSLELETKEAEALIDRNLQLLNDTVIPAYQRFLATLEVELELASDTVGMWSLPGGDEYYRALLKIYTTTDLSPEEVHQLGLQRVAALRAEMEVALVTLGYTRGSIAERMLELGQASVGSDDDEAVIREQILAELAEMVEKLEQGTAAAFHALPPQPLEVHAAPAGKEEGGLAYYYPPALDNSRPGIFYVNLRHPKEIQRFALFTLVAHEGIPGHHLQVASSQLLKQLPTSRRNMPIPAFGEGWALYSERLVFELGLHDTLTNLGRLSDEMFRAARLVVDTGLHAKRWERQRAITYMMENTGKPRSEVTAEIDRYIVMPGQACAYMVGALEITALREEAQARQGERFNLPDFHQAILKNGSLPLAILRREVTASLQ